MKDVPQAFVVFIGVAELVGAFGLILPLAMYIAPILTPIAAAGLATIVLLGALYHVARKEHREIGVNVVFFVLTLFIVIGRFKPASAEAGFNVSVVNIAAENRPAGRFSALPRSMVRSTVNDLKLIGNRIMFLLFTAPQQYVKTLKASLITIFNYFNGFLNILVSAFHNSFNGWIKTNIRLHSYSLRWFFSGSNTPLPLIAVLYFLVE